MVIDGWWWLLVMVPIGLIVAFIVSSRADPGGAHCCDFGDAFMGCVVPLAIVAAFLIAGLFLAASNTSVRLGFQRGEGGDTSPPLVESQQ